ncbi:ABC transporter ATP-binding protein [Alkalibacillus salilacus]|uniref:ATP-binding cassette subfamily B protein n=1 Tax=Alkalibacillus salilacus TaxID=284582 RepID=A0ABT9VED6_9BACI|nr:ABC transporter ATP-binding protein [Alkalibacillus salilacus]MDQ0159301.1 ATP-binding cassette subfamily B protein [Alkalibacillus salilacus]
MSLKQKLLEPFQYEKIDLSEANQSSAGRKPKVRNWKGTISRIWFYLWRQNWLLLSVMVLVMFSAAFSILGPYLIGRGVDDYIVDRQSDGFMTFILILLVIYLSYSITIFTQNFLMIGIAQNAVYRLRSQLFNQLHELPISFFDKRQYGEIMSRVTNDVDNISNTLNQSFIQIFQSILTLVGTVSVMLYLSPPLTLVTLTIVPLLVIGIKWITKRTRPLFKIQQNRIGELNGFVEETISGQPIVKTFSQENRVIREFEAKNNAVMHSSYWASVFSGFIPKVLNMLNSLSFALIAFAGSIFALNDMVTVGTIVIFTELARQFTRPLNELANQFNQLLTAVAGAERVFDIIDEESEEKDETHAIGIDEPRGDITFDHVHFAYDNEKVLDDVSFQVEAGSMVALVGHTGAGKTTIINLLSRFYEYDQGRILLDETDIKDIKRSSLRQYMGFVLQDAYLFEGTIRDNIRYGRLDATDEEVTQAAKLANAHEFIAGLPDQYDTVLDQDGSGISQGQKQLITIARVILSDPKILVLDEATSSIDTVTEIKIQQAMRQLMQGRTSIVIAHRLNTIRHADQIIMFENGKVIEKGSHKELIQQNGHYADLHQAQLNNQAQ